MPILAIRCPWPLDLSVRSYRNGKIYYFDASREEVLDEGMNIGAEAHGIRTPGVPATSDGSLPTLP